MGTPRKKNKPKDSLSAEAAGLLGEAQHGPDRADPSFSWEKKIKAKEKAQDKSYLTGWLKVRFSNDMKKVHAALKEMMG